MFLSFFLSCTSQTSPSSTQPMNRVEYILDQEWSSRPWEMKTDPVGQEIRMEATIDLEDSLSLEGAGLQFSGLWWKGQLQINGEDLPVFYGGNQETEIPVGTYLQHGKNQLILRLSAPNNISSRVTGGTPSSIIREKKAADLFFPPRLLLRPKNHISGMALPMKDGKITPIIWAEGENASQISLQIELDGKILQELGTCTISNGVSSCAEQKWTLEKWNIGDPHLYQLRGILKDEQGKILDQMIEKIGVRELNWSQQGIWINKEQKQPLSARMVHRRGGEEFFSRLNLYQQAGINTLEFHGELLRRDWLSIMDELGFGAAIVPRCVGRCNHKNGGSAKDQLAFMQLQDQRLLWDIKTHPSVTLFALEGDTNSKWSRKSLWTEYLQQNLHNIPVFGLDLPVRLLKMELQGQEISSQCLPNGCQGSWLVETVIQSKFPPWELLTAEYLQIQKQGAIGGVIPTPRKKIDPKEKFLWLQSWQSVKAELNPAPLSLDNKRASSQITVQSKKGEIVTIRGNGIRSIRKKADNNGLSSFDLFYQGNIEVQCGQKTLQTEVSADYWNQLKRTTNNSYVICPD